MRIRDLANHDLDAVLAMNNAAVPAVGELDAGRLMALLPQCVLALVAEDDHEHEHEVAGFCLVLPPGQAYTSVNYRWFSERYDDFAYLDRVVVLPQWQRQGVGRLLYDAVEMRTHAPWFLLEVNLRPRNDDSLSFHARLGFAEVGTQETDYGALVSMQAKSLRAH